MQRETRTSGHQAPTLLLTVTVSRGAGGPTSDTDSLIGYLFLEDLIQLLRLRLECLHLLTMKVHNPPTVEGGSCSQLEASRWPATFF